MYQMLALTVHSRVSLAVQLVTVGKVLLVLVVPTLCQCDESQHWSDP